MIDKNDKIQCQICKCWFKQINNSHLKLHEITVKEYKKLYPDFDILSNNNRQKLKDRWINPEYKERVSNTISNVIKDQWDNGKYNRIQSEDHKTKRAKSQSETKQLHIEDYRGEKSGNWKGGISHGSRLHVLPTIKCIQLNKKFDNSDFHHITKSIGIYIPIKLHRHIRHNLRTGKNMGEINMLALQFINGGL